MADDQLKDLAFLMYFPTRLYVRDKAFACTGWPLEGHKKKKKKKTGFWKGNAHAVVECSGETRAECVERMTRWTVHPCEMDYWIPVSSLTTGSHTIDAVAKWTLQKDEDEKQPTAADAPYAAISESLVWRGEWAFSQRLSPLNLVHSSYPSLDFLIPHSQTAAQILRELFGSHLCVLAFVSCNKHIQVFGA